MSDNTCLTALCDHISPCNCPSRRRQENNESSFFLVSPIVLCAGHRDQRSAGSRVRVSRHRQRAGPRRPSIASAHARKQRSTKGGGEKREFSFTPDLLRRARRWVPPHSRTRPFLTPLSSLAWVLCQCAVFSRGLCRLPSGSGGREGLRLFFRTAGSWKGPGAINVCGSRVVRAGPESGAKGGRFACRDSGREGPTYVPGSRGGRAKRDEGTFVGPRRAE